MPTVEDRNMHPGQNASYGDLYMSGGSAVLGNVNNHYTLHCQGTSLRSRPDFVGHYAYASSLRPVPNFVARPALHTKIWKQLHDTLSDMSQEAKVLIVSGLGGAGKSQPVLDYIQKYRHDYSAVFWIEAGRRETVERDFIQIYRLLFDSQATTGSEPITAADAVPAVKSWFHCRPCRRLVVLDSADSIDDVEAPDYIDIRFFMPDADGVDVIITTRSSAAQEMTNLEAVKVGEMTRSEAVDLFKKSAKLDQFTADVEQEVVSVVEELGCLALAVTLAGAYVAGKPGLPSIRRYLDEYRTQRKRLLSRKPTKYIHQYGESVLSTWETSFAAIARQSVTASQLLCFLAFLHFDDIWLGLFGGNRERTLESLISPETPLDLYALESAFEVLQRFSLVQWKSDRGSYSMHKLVHAWGHDRLDHTGQLRLSFGALQILVEYISTEMEPMSKLEVRPHIMACFRANRAVYESLKLQDRKRLDLIQNIGDFLYTTGQWSNVFEICDFHLLHMRELFGVHHPDTLMSVHNLAAVLVAQGKYEQAEEMTRRALAGSERVLGADHPRTLTSVHNLSVLLREQGNYEEADEMNRRAVTRREKVLGADHPHALSSVDYLALILRDQGKYEQAEEMNRRALAGREKVLGADHPDTLSSVHNLALMLWDQGKYEQAEEMTRRALGGYEKVLGVEHPDSLTSVHNLALMLRNQGKYEQAEEMNRRALARSEKMLGADHPHTLTSVGNLAFILGDQGKYEQAEEMNRRALAGREKVLGADHPHTLSSVHNLALTLRDQGKYEQAEEMTRRVLGGYEKVLGADHPDTTTSVHSLALILGDQGKYEEAEEMNRRALAGKEKVLGADHPHTLTSADNLAAVLRD